MRISSLVLVSIILGLSSLAAQSFQLTTRREVVYTESKPIAFNDINFPEKAAIIGGVGGIIGTFYGMGITAEASISSMVFLLKYVMYKYLQKEEENKCKYQKKLISALRRSFKGIGITMISMAVGMISAHALSKIDGTTSL